MTSLSQSSLESIKSKILTDIQYASKEEEEKDLEFHYEIQEGDKVIHYFGAFHRNDPAHPMFKQIQDEMDKFKPDMVYVEGVRALKNQTPEKLQKIKEEPLENFIKDGEPWFTAKLAIDRDILVEMPEPDFEDEIEYIKTKGFEMKDIFDFYMFRQLHQYQRHLRNSPSFGMDHFERYIQPYFVRLREVSGWGADIHSEFESDFLKTMDLGNMKYYELQVDPIPWKGKIETSLNEIARQSSLFRDRYIVERIAVGLQNHNRLFIVYGSAHAVKQEPALRELLKVIVD